jgi:hypothetical protein
MAKHQRQQQQQEDQQQVKAAAAPASAGCSQPAEASSSSRSDSEQENCVRTECRKLAKCYKLLEAADGAIPEEIIKQLQVFYKAYLHDCGVVTVDDHISAPHSSNTSSKAATSSTAMLNQLEKDLLARTAAAAAQLNSNEEVQRLNKLVVAAAMQAVREIAQAVHMAVPQQSPMDSNVSNGCKQVSADLPPQLCSATRNAVALGVQHVMLQSHGAPRQTEQLQGNEWEQIVATIADSHRQVRSVIHACFQEAGSSSNSSGSAMPEATTPGPAAGETARSTAAAGAAAAAAASEDHAFAKTTLKIQVRAKFLSAFSAEHYPTSLVGAKRHVVLTLGGVEGMLADMIAAAVPAPAALQLQ